MNGYSHGHGGDASRIPPCNVEAEQALLGALLINNDVYARVSGFLRPEHFAEEAHRRIYEVAAKLISEQHKATPITLKTWLGGHLLAPGLTTPAYLAQLAAEATTIVNAIDYGRMVVDLAARREIISAAEETAKVAYDAPVGHAPLRIIEDSIASFRAVADRFTEPGADESVDATLGSLIESAQDRLAGKAAAVPSSGFVDIDRTLAGGLRPGRLIVLAGRPGMGKTILMVVLGLRAAQYGAGVGIISLEIDRRELTARLVASAIANSDHPLDYRDILAGKLGELQIEHLCNTRRAMRNLPLEVCEQAGLSAVQIETRALQMHRRLARQGRRLDILLIDYLQLISPSDRYRSKPVEELGEIVLAAKNIAKRLGVCVVLLSQLNRGVESRENKRPMLSDLRGSGNIEEHADAVGLLYRPEYYDKDDPEVIAGEAAARLAAAKRRNLLELHWAKNRLGPTDTTRLFCDVARSQVENHSSERVV